MVFDAPFALVAQPPPYPGLLNLGQAPGGFEKQDAAPGLPAALNNKQI